MVDESKSAAGIPPIYIDGYFRNRLESGERPDTRDHRTIRSLPQVREGTTMEIVTSFMGPKYRA